MATNQTQFAWPLRKPQRLVYVELGPQNGGMMLGICELGLTFRAVAPLKSDGPIHFSFALDGKTRLQGVGELAWTEDDGKTGGLKFTTVSPPFRESLHVWLADGVSPKTAGREHTPAALPLDSIQKIKSSIREGKTDTIKVSVPRVEENFVEKVVEEQLPKVDSALVPQVFQDPIVPGLPVQPKLEAVRPQQANSPAISPSSDSDFSLPKFRLPSASPPPLLPEPRVAPPVARPPQPASALHAASLPLEIPQTESTIDALPPPAFAQDLLTKDLPTESPRLNRAAAAGIIALALAVILVALVLNFRRDVGEILIRLGQQLAGEQHPPSSSQQNPSSPLASAPLNVPAPASSPTNVPSPVASDQSSASTTQSQPAESPAQTPPVTAESTSTRPSTIQRIEDLPAPDGAGAGQKEFDQAKAILKGIHRQRDIQMAVTLLWTGVREGYVPAEVTLADLYVRGDGVERSCEQARVLLKAAVQKGSPEGRRRLALLKQQGCPAN